VSAAAKIPMKIHSKMKEWLAWMGIRVGLANTAGFPNIKLFPKGNRGEKPIFRFRGYLSATAGKPVLFARGLGQH
jgi:hypothetical protein